MDKMPIYRWEICDTFGRVRSPNHILQSVLWWSLIMSGLTSGLLFVLVVHVYELTAKGSLSKVLFDRWRQCGTIKLLNQNHINVRRLPEPFRLPHLCRPSASFSLQLIFCNSIMQNDAGSIQHELPSAVNKHIVPIDEELAYCHTENKYRRSSHTRYSIVFLLVVSGFLLCLTTRDHSRYPLLSKLSPWWST